MKGAFLVICVLFLLSSCGPPMGWSNPKLSPEEQEKDKGECRFEARKASTATPGSDIVKAFANKKVYDECMSAKDGYHYGPLE